MRAIARTILGFAAVLQVFLVLIAMAKPLYAYADPGTGMLMLQVASSMAAGAVYFLRSKIRRLFGRSSAAQEKGDSEQASR